MNPAIQAVMEQSHEHKRADSGGVSTEAPRHFVTVAKHALEYRDRHLVAYAGFRGRIGAYLEMLDRPEVWLLTPELAIERIRAAYELLREELR